MHEPPANNICQYSGSKCGCDSDVYAGEDRYCTIFSCDGCVDGTRITELVKDTLDGNVVADSHRMVGSNGDRHFVHATGVKMEAV